MCFVNDNQVECAEVTRLIIDRLDTGNDNRLVSISAFQPCGKDTQLDVRA